MSGAEVATILLDAEAEPAAGSTTLAEAIAGLEVEEPGLGRASKLRGVAVIKLANLTPPAIQSAVARLMFTPRLFNLTITNVPASPITLYALGAPLRRIVPLVIEESLAELRHRWPLPRQRWRSYFCGEFSESSGRCSMSSASFTAQPTRSSS
jgi:hypothetical protein